MIQASKCRSLESKQPELPLASVLPSVAPSPLPSPPAVPTTPPGLVPQTRVLELGLPAPDVVVPTTHSSSPSQSRSTYDKAGNWSPCMSRGSTKCEALTSLVPKKERTQTATSSLPKAGSIPARAPVSSSNTSGAASSNQPAPLILLIAGDGAANGSDSEDSQAAVDYNPDVDRDIFVDDLTHVREVENIGHIVRCGFGSRCVLQCWHRPRNSTMVEDQY